MIRFDYTSYRKNSILTVHMNGILTSATTDIFEKKVAPLVAQGKTIILDMNNLEYASSEGLGALIFLAKKADTQQCRLLIANPRTELKTLFHYIGFDNIMPIYETLDQILREISQGKDMTPSPFSPHTTEPSGDISPAASSEDSSNFFDTPLIVECAGCNSFLRVPKHGYFLCPSCRTEFEGKKSGTVVFLDVHRKDS
jgi:anti-anti-sigma factor